MTRQGNNAGASQKDVQANELVKMQAAVLAERLEFANDGCTEKTSVRPRRNLPLQDASAAVAGWSALKANTGNNKVFGPHH